MTTYRWSAMAPIYTPGTLDFANAFLFPGVESRAELVPSHLSLWSRSHLRFKSYLLGLNPLESVNTSASKLPC